MIQIAGLIILGIAVYWYWVLRPGRLGFWRLVAKQPDAAYDHFMSNACWKVFEDGLPQDYRSIVPRSGWGGPFRIVVPKLGDKTIKVFGRRTELEKSQNDLVKKLTQIT
jgi:hypothetical protein